MKKFLLLLTVMLGIAWQSNAQINWSYDESTATLTISGSGDMPNYSETSLPEWLTDDDAKNATSLIIEDGVASIGEYAFYNMKITKVVIPNSVKEICSNAFKNCQYLADIEWHGKGQYKITIASDAFSGIASNARVQYGINNNDFHLQPWKDAGLNCKLYYEWNLDYNGSTFTCIIKDGVFSIEGAGELGGVTQLSSHSTAVLSDADILVIGEGITSIANGCFDATSDKTTVTSIEFPSTLTTIKFNAFIGFNNVKELYIPAALTSISSRAFNGFSNLSTIVVDDENPNYTDGGGCNAIISKDGYYLYRGCCGTKIPVGITYINEGAFLDSNISGELTIPEGVKTINYYAFQNCKNLTGVVLPSTLSEIYDSNTCAFTGCSSLTTVTCLATTAPVANFDLGRKIATLYYPAGSDYSAWAEYFEEMKNPAGGDCGEDVKWELIGSTLKIDGTGAMNDYVEDAPEWCGEEYNDKITKVEVGEGVTHIGQRAFYNMPNLSNIVLPATLETIAHEAFPESATDYTITARSNAGSFDTRGYNVTLIIDDNLALDLLDNVNTFKSVVYNRTFAAGKVGTVVLPFELSDESKRKLTFYTLREAIGNYLVFDPVAVDDIKAGVPYIWENNTSGDVTRLTSVEDVVVAKETKNPEYDNESGWRLVGTFDNKNITEKEKLQTTYYLSSGKVMNATESLSISPYRAYFEGPRYDDTFGGGNDEPSYGRKMFDIVLRGEEGDGTTVIENVTIDENGELDFDNATYDLGGRRVDENTKGIVIKNGKKILVK